MARYAQLVATGLPPGAPVTIKQNGKQVSNLFPAAEAQAPDNRARTGDRSGALSPVTFVPNGTYTVAWSGGSKTVVVAGASGLPPAIPFDMATQAELDASRAGLAGAYSNVRVDGSHADLVDISTTPVAPADIGAAAASHTHPAQGITVQDENGNVGTAVTQIDFQGAGVTATAGTGEVVVTVPGGALTVKDEGSSLTTAADTLDFVGAGVTATGTGATKTITIPGATSGVTVQDEGGALATAATTLNFVGGGVTASGTGATKTVSIPGGAAPSSGTLASRPAPGNAGSQYVTTDEHGQVLYLDDGTRWLVEALPTRNPLRPTGSIAETTYRQNSALSSTLTPVSGTRYMIAVPLNEGVLVSSITLMAVAAAVSPTHQWFELLNSSRVVLRSTADDTTTAWAANAAKTLTLSSAVRTTYTGLYYFGVVQVATTPATLRSLASSSVPLNLAPILVGSSDTGLTGPVADGTTAAAITAGASIPYGYCA